MDRSFDIYDRIPEDMKAYLSNYGFNFSKKNVRMGRFKNED